jgi:MFS family permease
MRFFLRLLPAHDLLTLPTIRWLVLSRFCANIFFYSTTIVLFQQQRGLNLTAMFLMESFLSGAIWIADVPTSIWADRFSYRHMIILGRIFSLVGILCFVLFYGFWIFALANILCGFSIACTSGSESALLYSSLSTELREKRGKSAFALLSVASTGGLFLGLTTGSFIGAYSPTLAVVMSIGPLICSLMAAWRIPKQPTSQVISTKPQYTSIEQIIKTAWQSIRHQPRLIGLGIFNSAAFSLINAIFWFNQLYFARAGIPVVLFGPLMAIAVGLQFFLVARMNQFLSRLGVRMMLILSCFLPAMAYLLLMKMVQPFLTATLVTSIIACSSWRDPLVSEQLNKAIPDKSRATTLSALSLIGSCTGIVLNPWIGSLGDQGLMAVGLGMGICLLLLCVLVPFVVKKPQRSNGISQGAE